MKKQTKKIQSDRLGGMTNAIEKKQISIIDILKGAEEEAFRQGIEVNTIILNENYDMTRNFYAKVYSICGFRGYPPMILGKKLICSDFLPDKYYFALTKTSLISPYEELQDLKELIKQYVQCDGESLKFKGLSYKKNIEDFNKFKKILEEKEK